VTTKEGETIAADFFVDCTGFAGVLIQKALGTPFIPFADNLFNDSAIAMPTPMDERFLRKRSRPPCATAGNGRSRSRAVTERLRVQLRVLLGDEAERELRESLGLLDSSTEARHLKMKTGRLHQALEPELLAVGLSQGFIEPLEATALLSTAHRDRVRRILRGGRHERARAGALQPEAERALRGTRDYIVTHYKTNSRTDTEYWRANAANMNLSDR